MPYKAINFIGRYTYILSDVSFDLYMHTYMLCNLGSISMQNIIKIIYKMIFLSNKGGL